MKVYDDEKAGDNIMSYLVSKLKEEMEKQDVSMNKLARDSGISLATISRIINEKSYANFGTLFTLFCEMNIELTVTGYAKDSGEAVL